MGCLVIGQLLLRHHMIRPQDSAEEVVSPLQCGYRLWALVDRFTRTSTYAVIITHTGVWKHWLSYTAFRIPYFSGRKSTTPEPDFIHAQISDSLNRIASFFVAFVFVALVNTEGEWQRYPTAAVMFVFIVLLIWCIWTTWEGRADFVERVCHFTGGSPMSGQGEHTPLQPEQHDGPETSQFRSVRVDLNTD